MKVKYLIIFLITSPIMLTKIPYVFNDKPYDIFINKILGVKYFTYVKYRNLNITFEYWLDLFILFLFPHGSRDIVRLSCMCHS